MRWPTSSTQSSSSDCASSSVVTRVTKSSNSTSAGLGTQGGSHMKAYSNRRYLISRSYRNAHEASHGASTTRLCQTR
jgi:hypothetical protein